MSNEINWNYFDIKKQNEKKSYPTKAVIHCKRYILIRSNELNLKKMFDNPINEEERIVWMECGKNLISYWFNMKYLYKPDNVAW